MCGAVRYRVTPPTLWCAHCHCTLCRAAHGAAFVTWVGVAADGFRIVKGNERLASYHSTPEATRRFCTACGTTMTFESSRWPGEVHLTRASFDGEIDRQVSKNAYPETVAAWSGGMPAVVAPPGD